MIIGCDSQRPKLCESARKKSAEHQPLKTTGQFSPQKQIPFYCDSIHAGRNCIYVVQHTNSGWEHLDLNTGSVTKGINLGKLFKCFKLQCTYLSRD